MAGEIQTALVVGASRGLGKGLVHELASRGVSVTGTIRDVARIESLRADAPGHVSWQLCDIDDDASVENLTRTLAHPRYDLVFVNAGVGAPEGATVQTAGLEAIGALFRTNAVSPARLARRLTPYVNAEHGVVGFMTSILGSVTLAEGTYDLYSASKAALNSLSRAYAASVAATRLTVVSMHPGWVKTDLGGDEAPLTVAQSVKGIADVLLGLPGAGGHRYVDYTGKTLPW